MWRYPLCLWANVFATCFLSAWLQWWVGAGIVAMVSIILWIHHRYLRCIRMMLQLNYVQGDVSAYLRYIAGTVRFLAETHGVKLEIDCPRHVILMDYDPNHLLQIVYNLLSTAIKFTPAGGGVAMQVELAIGYPKKLIIIISNADTGKKQASLPTIFDRIFQSRNLEKASADGISLALTKQLVVAMEGTISIKSTIKKRTSTFKVVLPISNNGKRVLHQEWPPATDHSVSGALMDDAFVQKLRDIVIEHLPDSSFGVPELCRSAAMSRPKLHRKLTALTGQNPSHFIRSMRLGYARKLLLSRKLSVQEAATETGFDDPKYFSRAFAEEFGLPPSRI